MGRDKTRRYCRFPIGRKRYYFILSILILAFLGKEEVGDGSVYQWNKGRAESSFPAKKVMNICSICQNWTYRVVLKTILLAKKSLMGENTSSKCCHYIILGTLVALMWYPGHYFVMVITEIIRMIVDTGLFYQRKIFWEKLNLFG